jgi:hypothetical protein
MPDAVKGEFVNVGVVLLDEAARVAGIRFTHDYRRLRCLDPNVDLEQVRALEVLLKARLAERATVKEVDSIASWMPSAFQVSGVSAVDTHDFPAELSKLANLYLKTKRPKSEAKAEKPAGLRMKMRGAFNSDELRKVFRWDIPVGEYVPGDPLVIDCGYVSDGVLKMFHAVPLNKKGEVKDLAFSYPAFSEAFGKQSDLKTALTAITPNHVASDIEQFATSTFQMCNIERVRISEIERLKGEIRKELRL